jgi:hypothetical protein
MFAVINQLHFCKPVDELTDIVKNDGMVILSNFRVPGFSFYQG